MFTNFKNLILVIFSWIPRISPQKCKIFGTFLGGLVAEKNSRPNPAPPKKYQKSTIFEKIIEFPRLKIFRAPRSTGLIHSSPQIKILQSKIFEQKPMCESRDQLLRNIEFLRKFDNYENSVASVTAYQG